MSEYIQIPKGITLEEAERIFVQAALSDCKGNKLAAARILGISRTGLDQKLRRWARWWARTHEREPQVYCIRDDDRQLVKIGWSSSPIDRMDALACSAGAELRLLHTVKCSSNSAAMCLEAFLHEEFREHRGVSEWFRDADEIVSRDFLSRASRFQRPDKACA